LSSGARADAAGGLGQRDAPVDPDHVRARLAEEAEQFPGADTEVDARHARRFQGREDPAGVREDRLPVVLGADHADP
jgi:3-mercaptopyruvate sulfurtransferase SseA